MTRIILPLMALFAGFFVVSCDDEEETVVQVPPGLAQFEKSQLSLSESSAKTTITITFNRQAIESGEVSIQVSSSNVEKFQFHPAALNGIIHLPFAKGQSKVSFEVMSLDNDVLDGDKTLDFVIASISQGYNIGVTKTLSTVWVDDETPSRVNFEDQETEGRENNGDGYPITILFSHAAKADGVVRVAIQSNDAVYGTHFTTEPAVTNGMITFLVAAGKNEVVFKVFPLDDELYNEQRSISYTIVETQGALEKGDFLRHDLKISDDELEGTGKGYEVFAGSWRYKERHEYNEDGSISKVYWDQEAPGNHVGGVYSYVYNASGQLDKIIRYAGREEIFIREGGRIVKSEEYTNNVLTKYILYGYDPAGNVAEAAVHYRIPDGTLKLSTIFVYLYHTDHNLYKMLNYSVIDGYEDPMLNNTKTFDHYLDVENPFPMVEVLPDQKAQNKLPASYRVEEGGHDITYQFSYQFSGDGRPLSRTATSPSASEIAYYEYY